MATQTLILSLLGLDGSPESGGLLYSYVRSTTTPQAVYTDSGLTTPATNPVVASALGAVTVYFNDALSYSITCKTANEATTLFQFDIVGGVIALTYVNPAYSESPIIHVSWVQALGSTLQDGWTNALGVNGRTLYLDASESTAADDALIIMERANILAALNGGQLIVSGTFIIASTIVIPKGVTIRSVSGPTQAIFYVTADFGDTARMGVNTAGNTAGSQSIEGVWFWRPHTYVAGTTTTLDNPTTSNPSCAHLRIYNADKVKVKGCWFYGNPYGIVWDGGTFIDTEDCFFAGNYWDNVTAGLQEGKALIYGILSTLNSGFPTCVRIVGNWLGGGGASAARSVDWGSGGVGEPVAMDHINVGAKVAVLFESFEVLEISGNYIGGQNEYNIKIDRQGTIGTGLVISNNYIDSSRLSQIGILGAGNDKYIAGSVITNNFLAGAQTCLHGIEIGVSPNFGPMAIDTTISNNYFRDHIGSPIKLLGANGVKLLGNVYKNYNFFGLSTTNPDFATAVYMLGVDTTSGSTKLVTAVGESFISGGVGENAPGSGSNYLKYGYYTSNCTTDAATFNFNPDSHMWRGMTTGALLVGDITTGYKQPLDQELTAIAGLTSAADKVPYYTGSGAAALADFTSTGRTLAAAASKAAGRAALDLDTGNSPTFAGLTLGASSSFSPTITSGGGTITTVGTVTARTFSLGKMRWISLDITITTNGTGATSILSTLPANANQAATFHGRNHTTGAAITGVLLAAGTQVTIRKTTDDTYPAADGARLIISGWYESV